MNLCQRLVAAGVVVLVCAGSLGQDWPSFRGPDGSGMAEGSSPPVRFGEDEALAWKVDVPGAGLASPIVVGERVFVATAVEAEVVPVNPMINPTGKGPWYVYSFRLLAFDRATGEVLWDKELAREKPHQSKHPDGTFADQSPVSDGERVYAFFGSRGLFCLTLEGELLWERDFGEMSIGGDLGEAATVALTSDSVIVPWSHRGDSWLAAVDKRTGEDRWRAERISRTAWSSPAVATADGRELAMVIDNEETTAYDAATGEVVWRAPGVDSSPIPTGVVADGFAVFMGSSRGVAVRLAGATGDLAETDSIAWTARRATPYIPSPAISDGICYFLRSSDAVLSAVRLADGSAVYRGERLGDLGTVYASPVIGGGHVYVCGREGGIAVVRAGERPEVVFRTELDGGISATPAIAGGDLIVRTNEKLYRFTNAGGE
ncbi:MAG: PQQ-binding-like beta-propeller repeat protein [Planctomycetota bacterium]